MDDKLLVCEQCENLVSVNDNNEPIFVCPACGTINKRDQSQVYEGFLEIKGPDLECEIEDFDGEDLFTVANLPEEVEYALMVLMKYGWGVKFKGKEKD
jgi:hypothetical protein